MQRMEKVCRQLRFHNFEMVEAKGSVGGLLLMWTDEVRIKVDWKNDQVMCCGMLDHDGVRK